MEHPSVYLETSVISYYTARPHRDVVTVARQTITQEWWDFSRQQFQTYVSVLVLKEAEAGDAIAAQKRLALIDSLPVLGITEDAEGLASSLLKQKLIPPNSAEDALHIAIATLHGMDFILTWNFRHINNAVMKTRIRASIESQGYQCPIICSPEELRGNHDS